MKCVCTVCHAIKIITAVLVECDICKSEYHNAVFKITNGEIKYSNQTNSQIYIHVWTNKHITGIFQLSLN